MDNDVKRLRKQLEEFDTVVLITRRDGDAGHARPMAVAGIDDNCDLWFVTSQGSDKTREILADTQAEVICQKGWTSCVSIAGHAALVVDRAMIQKLWKPSFKVWFPSGADDPNLVLIHFSGERAEFWDNTGAKRLSYFYQAVKGLLHGSTPELHGGEHHGTVTLKS